MNKSYNYLKIKQVFPVWKTLVETKEITDFIVQLKSYKHRINMVNYSEL